MPRWTGQRLEGMVPARACALSFALAFALVVAPAAAQATGGPRGPRLAPIPATGGVPPIVAPRPRPADFLRRAHRCAREIRLIRRKHFGRIRVPAIRAEGIAQIRAFTDPAAFPPLIDELAGEDADVRLALLDHFAQRGDEGQAALARVAVADPDAAMRHEAMQRMVGPPADPVLRVLDEALRSPRHDLANHAGAVAGTIGALRAIPLLIFAQGTRDPRPDDHGDLAWIAVQTQTAFVANVAPVVGDHAAAFQPILGVINEGAVLRVEDAVVIVYRTVVHRALVNLTTRDWGRSTEAMGYDMKQWWQWYNRIYVPMRNERIRREELAGG